MSHIATSLDPFSTPQMMGLYFSKDALTAACKAGSFTFWTLLTFTEKAQLKKLKLKHNSTKTSILRHFLDSFKTKFVEFLKKFSEMVNN